METNFKIKKIFLIAGGVLILLAVLLLIFTRTTSEVQKPAGQTTIQAQPEEMSAVQASKEETNKSNVLVLASSFAERFGSFSNQSDFQNIRDLFPFMTASMQNWAESYIETQRAGISSGTYAGVTTKSLSRKFLSLSENAAEILVSTQRRESTGVMANETVTYKDMELKLVKEGEDWKVDGVWWR
jgi:hypothetical protein